MVTNQLTRNYEKLENVKIMENILRSIDSNFDHIVSIIVETKDLVAMTMEQLLGSLQPYEEKRKKKEETVEQLLKPRIDSTKEGNVQNNRSQQGQGCGRE